VQRLVLQEPLCWIKPSFQNSLSDIKRNVGLGFRTTSFLTADRGSHRKTSSTWRNGRNRCFEQMRDFRQDRQSALILSKSGSELGLSRQRPRVRVPSSPPFQIKHLQKWPHPGVGTKRYQKGTSGLPGTAHAPYLLSFIVVRRPRLYGAHGSSFLGCPAWFFS
jgi:hypothetical protein